MHDSKTIAKPRRIIAPLHAAGTDKCRRAVNNHGWMSKCYQRIREQLGCLSQLRSHVVRRACHAAVVLSTVTSSTLWSLFAYMISVKSVGECALDCDACQTSCGCLNMPVRSPFSCRLCVLSLLYFAVAATGLVTTVASSLSLVRTDRLLSFCCLENWWMV